MNNDIQNYNSKQTPEDRVICDKLFEIIENEMSEAESKVWHGHPVWFLDGNPIVGYSKLKDSVRLLFWSGQSFDESELVPEGSFKAAELRFTEISQIDEKLVKRCLEKSKTIQWDYKNIVKRKGKLERLK